MTYEPEEGAAARPEPPGVESGAPPTAAAGESPVPLLQRDGMGWGVLWGLGILVGVSLLMAIPPLTFMVLFPGATLWLVVIPLSIRWHRQGRRATLHGLLITTGIVTLLNATCTAVLLGNLGNMH